jgi:hypothetical protein
MSDHAFDFLQSWIVENINATMYVYKDTAEHLADDCIWEANTRGITEVALIEAAGSDLDEYMLAKLNRVVGLRGIIYAQSAESSCCRERG